MGVTREYLHLGRLPGHSFACTPRIRIRDDAAAGQLGTVSVLLPDGQSDPVALQRRAQSRKRCSDGGNLVGPER